MLEWELPGEPLGPRGPAGKEGWLEEEVFLLGPWEKAEGRAQGEGAVLSPLQRHPPPLAPALPAPLLRGAFPDHPAQWTTSLPSEQVRPLSSRRPGHVPLENWCWKRSLHIGGTAIFVALVPLARIYQ